ncbi:CDP-glycerol glycerophosphotransferase family protein [Weissella ceti]|uniref:CDP-glycerol glycerophosphotransferase family protein n=1 Tax=Weissella ceti TaxID=759620 RepID=A0ABT3E579_9LACO|nr:CDP-glycerol glycerophosphotransferase family protein [Weissella ceti]MCW0953068.1 CDP-glycerol glycerophosphotransferase family protein [Weissella ceti]QVK11611.1 CDP-glycerol glycerophosphotransferase family protein [Weissella ceti]
MQQLKNKIKNSTLLGRMYGVLQLSFIKFLQLFVRVDDKQIMFMAYSGRQFSDSPREAFELLQADPAYADFKFVWAFNDPKAVDHSGITKKVSANSVTYFYHLLRSKYWVSNASIERLTPFKHPKNVYIQFWHGIPMKHLGVDEKSISPLVKRWYQNADFDYLFTYGQYDTERFKRIFPAAQRYNEVGQLRKHALEKLRLTFDRKQSLEQLHLNPNKPTLLYAPTFREYTSDNQNLAYLGRGALSELAVTYNVIYRGHYFMERGDKIPGVVVANDMDLNALFLMSDVLVTDYSSLLFDYAAELKPIYLYEADLAEYQEKRGLYISGEELSLPVAHSEAELLNMLGEGEKLETSAVEDVLTYYNSVPTQKTVDFLFEIIPAAD